MKTHFQDLLALALALASAAALSPISACFSNLKELAKEKFDNGLLTRDLLDKAAAKAKAAEAAYKAADYHSSGW